MQKFSRERKEERKVEKLFVEKVPGLEIGFNLVEGSAPVLQRLVARELEDGGEAVWIDSGNKASTYALANAGSGNLMERVRIGRAFTPFQHHKLVQDLEDFVDSDTEVLVVPNFTLLYLEGQTSDWESRELFEESWNKLKEIQESYSLKVLLTVSGDSDMDYVVRTFSQNRIEVEDTSVGRKYESGDFETEAYREDGLVQTTIPFWRRRFKEVRL